MVRSRWWLALLVLAIIAGVFIWRRPEPVDTIVTPPAPTDETFSSERLRVRFDYPAGWTAREVEHPGEWLGEVQVFGPRREDLQYSVYIDVSAAPAERADLHDAVEAALDERRRQPSYVVVEKHERPLAGQDEGVEVTSSFELPLPLKSANPQLVPFREQIAYVLRDGDLFRLAYVAPADDFDAHRHAFERLTTSFSFLP